MLFALVGLAALYAAPVFAETVTHSWSVVQTAETASSGRSDQSASNRKSTTADAYTVGIAASSPNEVEFTIVSDIAAVLTTGYETGPHGESFRVLPVVNTGGLQGIRDVVSWRGVDLAIIPVDLLDILQNRNEFKGLKDKLVYVARLFDQELHIVASPEVTQLTDLAGRTVNIGHEGSSTSFLAREIFKRLGISVTEANLALADALEKMGSGEIAAAMILSSKPIPLLRLLGHDSRYHFLPVAPQLELSSNFERVTLTSEDYPDLISSGERVQTIATRSALVAYNWPASSDRYRVLQTFVQLFFPRIADLQRLSPHPKWREVDLAANLAGWKRFRPAAEWLAKQDRLVTGSTLRSDFERFLSSQGQLPKSDSERERLFQDFLRWREIKDRK